MSFLDKYPRIKAIILFFISFCIFYFVFSLVFLFVWPYLTPTKLMFIPIETIFVLGYLYLLHKYLKKRIGEDKYLRYKHCFKEFLLFFIIFLLAYIGSDEFGKPTRANLLIITFWLSLVYGILAVKYKKKNNLY